MVKFLFFFLLSFQSLEKAAAQSDPGTVEAEKDLVYYSADIISADLITETASLTGNVKILFDSYELSAKNATVNKKENSLIAWGDVVIEGNSSYVEADKADLNYKDQTGDLENIRLIAGQLFLQAKTLKKLSNTVYEATQAKFTTCNTCPPGWSVKGKKITMDITKYIDVRGGKFKILNQSIIPLPRIVYPLNTRRKTGVLQPSLTQAPGTSGLGFELPFFWAIDPHRDLTLTPVAYMDLDFNERVMEFNGFNGAKLHSEYNQWLGSKSKLNVNAAYMYDDTYLDINGSPDPSNRWFIDYSNYFVLPRNIIQKTNFSFLKERTYLQDFTNEISGFGLPALRNNFSLSKAQSNRFTSAEVVYYINLLVEDPSQSENLSIHKLPELSYDITETPLLGGKLLFKANSTYSNFHRNSNSFDSVTLETPVDDADPSKTIGSNSGSFDAAKDLIRTGHRLRFDAQLAAPFKISDLFDVMPALNYRDSYYSFNVSKDRIVNESSSNPYSQFANSRYLELETSFRTEFSKVITKNIKHKIAPELTLKIGAPVDRTDNIFFESSQEDLPYHRQYQPITDNDFFNSRHGVQFDYWDRFFRAEVAEFSITNVLIRKNKQGLVTYYDQPFFLSLTQSYDFLNERTAAVSDPWSNLDGVLKLRTKKFTNLTKFSHFYKAERTNITTTNTFNYRPGQFFSIGYSDFFLVDQTGQLIINNRTQNINFGFGWGNPYLKLSGRINYSLQDSKHLGWRGDIGYTPKGNCWGITIGVYEPNSQSNRQDGNLGFDGSLHINFGPDPRTRKSLLTI